MSAEREKKPDPAQERVERILFFISLVIVLGVVAALVWIEVSPGPRGTLVTAKVTQVERAEGRVIVSYEVTNRGDEAIADVQGKVSAGPEDVTQPLAHLPMGVTRRGVAVLDEVPAGAAPEVRVEGYLEP